MSCPRTRAALTLLAPAAAAALLVPAGSAAAAAAPDTAACSTELERAVGWPGRGPRDTTLVSQGYLAFLERSPECSVPRG